MYRFIALTPQMSYWYTGIYQTSISPTFLRENPEMYQYAFFKRHTSNPKIGEQREAK